MLDTALYMLGRPEFLDKTYTARLGIQGYRTLNLQEQRMWKNRREIESLRQEGGLSLATRIPPTVINVYCTRQRRDMVL